MKSKIFICLLILLIGMSGCTKDSANSNNEIISSDETKYYSSESIIENSSSSKTEQQKHSTKQDLNVENFTAENVAEPAVPQVSATEPKPTPKPSLIPTPTPTPIPTPKPAEPEVCKQCMYKNLPCDAIIDNTVYREVFSTQNEAQTRGYYYIDELRELNGVEITNFSVQPIYNNHGIAVSYGLELWSNGNLI